MKITPRNQTLILASEGRAPATPPGSSQAKNAFFGDAVLQHVTIVASQPDNSLLYLRADYTTGADGGGAASGYAGHSSSCAANVSDAEFADSPSVGNPRSIGTASSAGNPAAPAASSLSALTVRPQSGSASRDGYGNALGARRDTGISSHLPPVEQYAQTQRRVGVATAVQRLDVRA